MRAPRPRFSWQWEGPEVTWELVLLDEALDEVQRVQGIRGLQYVANDALAAAVAAGGTFLWFVQGEIQGRPFRSLPTAVTFTH